MFAGRHFLFSPLLATGALTGAMLASTPAFAGGFYLQEQSPKETGRAMSGGAAAGDDPSTIYTNPAAMTQLNGIQTSIGANGKRPRQRRKPMPRSPTSNARPKR